MRFSKHYLAATAMAVGLTVPSLRPAKAEAYVHSWGCNPVVQYARCADFTGTVYNPWVVVVGNFGTAGIQRFTGMCVKAETQAGSIKSGSACYTTLGPNGNNFLASPTSQGYFYFGDDGRSTVNNGQANT